MSSRISLPGMDPASLSAAYSPLKATSRAQRIGAAVQSFDLARALWPVMDYTMTPRIDSSAANAASSITGGVTTAATPTGPFTLSGAAAYTTDVAGGLPGYLGPDDGHDGTVQAWFELVTDAPVIEYTYLGTASPLFRLIVDGEATTAAYTAANGASGAPHRLTVTFGTRKWRRILLDSSGMFVSGVTVGPLDTIIRAAAAPASLAIIGDSYLENQSGELGFTAARVLGMRPMLNGSAGTGYNATGGGTPKETYAGTDRLDAVLAAQPDALVVFGGMNDATDTLQADALNVITTARATLPDLPIVLVGSQSPPGTTSGTTKSALLKAAAAAGKAAFVDMSAGNIYAADGTQLVAGTPWITGTGNTTAPAGAGNADLYIGSDTTHPSPGTGPGDPTSGYVYHGVRLAQALRIALPNAIV